MRNDGQFTSVTYQFFVSGGGSHLDKWTDMGNLKRVQFILNYDGVDQVEWGNKDRDACLQVCYSIKLIPEVEKPGIKKSLKIIHFRLIF